MKTAIMQPYFLPYIGYFQLIAAADLFIVYDNIKYTKKGWFNRNRMLQNGSDALFSLPLKNDSDFLDVRDRELAVDFDRDKLLARFANAYRRAPHFDEVFPLIERIVRFEENNLFAYVDHSIRQVCSFLGIETELRISSQIPIDHGLKSQDKVLALCREVGVQTYINPIGGTELYSKEAFAENGIELRFLRTGPVSYLQFGQAFVPSLSIMDVMMFNARERISTEILGNFTLI